MAFRVVIVEDEPHAQVTLKDFLHRHDDITVVGTAATTAAARALCDLHQPELVFCDVHLPPHTSFDWLQTYPALPFDIIFTTSFEEYAVKAFRLAAVDYLVKPLDEEQLSISLDKFRQRKQAGDSAAHVRQLLSNLSMPPALARVALPSLTGFLFVAVKDIVRCESDNTYTTFYLMDKRKIVVSKTLKECEQMLTDYRFFRVHNSHLVNLDYLVEYVKGEGGVVKMADGSHVDVSRRRKDEFLKALK